MQACRLLFLHSMEKKTLIRTGLALGLLASHPLWSGNALAAPAQVQAPAKAAVPKGLEHLAKVNPHLTRILQKNPGVEKYLLKMAARGAVFDGAMAAGERATPVRWTIWNHSEQTAKGINGYPAYGHGMKDVDILDNDVVVVWQQQVGQKTTIEMGWNSVPGQIVGVYQLRDQVQGRWADGGFSGEMAVEGHGKPGEKTVMAWATVSIGTNGEIRGGGYPDMAGGLPVPWQKLKAEGRRASGHQYEGRASEIIHGQTNQVPLADGDTWAKKH